MEKSNTGVILENKDQQCDDETIKNFFKEINSFRMNPESFLNKNNCINDRKIKKYEKFINSLEPKQELKLNKMLCSIAKEEVNKYSNSSEYEVIQNNP